MKIHFNNWMPPLLISVLVALGSCIKFQHADDGVLYYRIANHSEYRITVVAYDFWNHPYYNFSSTDSVFAFNPGETRDLVAVYGRFNKNYPEESRDTLRGIGILKILRSDSLSVTKNYRLTKFWSYTKPDEYKHLYSLEITNGSFTP